MFGWCPLLPPPLSLSLSLSLCLSLSLSLSLLAQTWAVVSWVWRVDPSTHVDTNCQFQVNLGNQNIFLVLSFLFRVSADRAGAIQCFRLGEMCGGSGETGYNQL